MQCDNDEQYMDLRTQTGRLPMRLNLDPALPAQDTLRLYSTLSTAFVPVAVTGPDVFCTSRLQSTSWLCYLK